MAVLSRLLLRAKITTSYTIRSFCSSYTSSPPSSSDIGVISPSLASNESSDQRNVQWVFLGCPGVGKGTYASRLSKLLAVPHIATGDLVRDELSSKGPLSFQLSEIVNQGKLVPDEIIFNLLSKRLRVGEDKGESGFILDGFPRTIRQAEILEGVTNIHLVINLKLREEALLAKCLGRRTCSQCGGNYNVACIDIKADHGSPAMYMPPLLPPPHCASKLITRSDDTEQVVKERFRIYHEKSLGDVYVCLGLFWSRENRNRNGNYLPGAIETVGPSNNLQVVMDNTVNCKAAGSEIEKSQPVEEFYRIRGKLLEFDLPGGIPESWTKLLQALNLDDHEDTRSAAA